MTCLSSEIINLIAGTDPHQLHHVKEIGQIFHHKYINFIRKKNVSGKWFGQMCFFFYFPGIRHTMRLSSEKSL